MHALLCPHGRDLDDLARELATDLDVGLSEPAAEQLLRRLGPNRLPAPERPAYLAIAARQLADPLVALLVAATAVSFLIGEYLAASVIAGIVLLNGVLGFVQEAGAERAVLALRRALRPVASVIRGGQERERLVEEIVPGDLVVLREGDRARLLALDDADRHQPHDATRETRPPDDVNHARDVLVGERRCLGQRLVRRAAHADPRASSRRPRSPLRPRPSARRTGGDRSRRYRASYCVVSHTRQSVPLPMPSAGFDGTIASKGETSAISTTWQLSTVSA